MTDCELLLCLAEDNYLLFAYKSCFLINIFQSSALLSFAISCTI